MSRFSWLKPNSKQTDTTSRFAWLRPKSQSLREPVPPSNVIEPEPKPELADYEKGLLRSLTEEFDNWIFSINETPISDLDSCQCATTLHHTKRWITLKRVPYTICGSRRYESGYQIQYNGILVDDRVEKAFLETCTRVIREKSLSDRAKSLSDLRDKLSTPPDLTK